LLDAGGGVQTLAHESIHMVLHCRAEHLGLLHYLTSLQVCIPPHHGAPQPCLLKSDAGRAWQQKDPRLEARPRGLRARVPNRLMVYDDVRHRGGWYGALLLRRRGADPAPGVGSVSRRTYPRSVPPTPTATAQTALAMPGRPRVPTIVRALAGTIATWPSRTFRTTSWRRKQ